MDQLVGLLFQILALRVPHTVMYYNLVTSISLEPSRTELKRRLDVMVVHHGLHSLCNFDDCGNLNVVARADFGFEGL